MSWQNLSHIPPQQYTCGYCERSVASNLGCHDHSLGGIYICPACASPTFFSPGGTQTPGVPLGEPVLHLPGDVENLYDEARKCLSVSSYTSAVMSCRKLLMHIAVEKGADENQKFIDYIDWLQEKNYIPPDGRHWVDYIRQKGNEANHEILLIGKEDAESLIKFLGMLMKFIYEFPSLIPDQEVSEKPD